MVYVAWEFYVTQAGLDKHFVMCKDKAYVQDVLRIGKQDGVDVVVLHGDPGTL